MKRFETFVIRLSQWLDRVAGWCLVGVMLLVVSNVLLRGLVKKPIQGTYEFVGFITAAAIALALAYCAVQDAHISVGIVIDKLPKPARRIVDIITKALSLAFLNVISWNALKFAADKAASGEVSSTSQTPVYPFIYIMAAGLIALSLAVLMQLVKSVGKGMGK